MKNEITKIEIDKKDIKTLQPLLDRLETNLTHSQDILTIHLHHTSDQHLENSLDYTRETLEYIRDLQEYINNNQQQFNINILSRD